MIKILISLAIKKYRGLLLLMPLMLLTACSTNVQVTGDYPSALTRPAPHHVGLVMDQAFTNYVYKSNIEQGVSMSLGQSQSKLFNQVFSDMFATLTRYQTHSKSSAQNVDLMVVPHIEDVQLAMPFETQLNVFEVWLKYNIQVFNSEGEPIADWLMSCYGKTQTRFLKSEEEALNQATTAALRDAGVRLITGFKQVPEISDWLEQQVSEPMSKGDNPTEDRKLKGRTLEGHKSESHEPEGDKQ